MADLGSTTFNPNTIRETAISFQKSRMLLTAFELDIFTALDGHLGTSEEIAAKLNLNERALDRLLNALTAMGFVSKTHNKFFNTPETSKYLVKGKRDYMAGLMHTNNLWENWSTLTEAVRTGTSVRKRNPDDKMQLEYFISAMHYRAVPQAKIISMLLDFQGVGSILDLGGGSGAFAMTFAKNNPGLKGVVFDVPGVIELTKKYVSAEGMNESISFIGGNYLLDDIGSGYDMIFASAIMHINSFDENKALIAKCSNALNKGGQLIILDHVMNEDRTEPQAGTLFAINMLVGTEAGDTYTESEYKAWMSDAGLTKLERKDTSFGTALIIGRK